MSMNNSTPPRPQMAPLANSGMMNPSISSNSAFSQPQPQASSSFQSQFQLSQMQAAAHAQLKAQQQAQFQGHAQSHYQAQLHAQLGNSQNNMANIGLSSPAFAAALNAKRIPQKPPVHPPGIPMTSMISPQKAIDLSAARRKRQKLPEKQLHERVAAILPESTIYTQLLEFESRVDSALARKKIDIQESLKTPPITQKVLRIYVFNTFENQMKSIHEKPVADPPTWSLKIIGKLLEDGADPDQPGVTQNHNPIYPKFSAFFKRVTISLDQRLYPENPVIVWENARSSGPQDGFEVKRKGDKEFTVNLRLEMNYIPEKFKLSPALMEVLGIEVDTRPRIIAAIWHYVKARKLQSPEDPSIFICDPPLQKVFGESRMRFNMVSQRISQHLAPPQPIHLEHKIKLSGNSPSGTACYDVLVDVPFPIQRELTAILSNADKNKEIETCDEAISTAIRKIHEHRRRRAFFLGFSQSPVQFINSLVHSQTKDTKLLAGQGSRNIEKERRADFFNQPWVEDAVIRYLNRKPAGIDN